jgi:hypothetical protein
MPSQAPLSFVRLPRLASTARVDCVVMSVLVGDGSQRQDGAVVVSGASLAHRDCRASPRGRVLDCVALMYRSAMARKDRWSVCGGREVRGTPGLPRLASTARAGLRGIAVQVGDGSQRQDGTFAEVERSLAHRIAAPRLDGVGWTAWHRYIGRRWLATTDDR